MKTIVIPISDPLKAKLDALRSKGYTQNGYVRAVLERALADPGELDAQHLTAKAIARIEEAMNTGDLEFMVETVDEIVRQAIRRQNPRRITYKPKSASPRRSHDTRRVVRSV